MKFLDPKAIYNAATNHEAHLLCQILIDSGIAAKVIEDNSPAGIAWVGPLAEIHKPQIWVERNDMESAKAILAETEKHTTELGAARESPQMTAPILVHCEKCDKHSEFPASQFGSVQSCPFCYAYVDVGDDVGFDDWEETESEDQPNH